MNMEPVDYTALLRELAALLEEKRKFEHAETNARNSASATSKQIEAKRKEIAKAVLAADRDLGYIIGAEYGMVSKSSALAVPND